MSKGPLGLFNNSKPNSNKGIREAGCDVNGKIGDEYPPPCSTVAITVIIHTNQIYNGQGHRNKHVSSASFHQNLRNSLWDSMSNTCYGLTVKWHDIPPWGASCHFAKSVKFHTDIHVPLRLNCCDFYDPLTFPLALSSSHNLHFLSTLVYG